MIFEVQHSPVADAEEECWSTHVWPPMHSVVGPGEGYGLKPPWVIADPGEASYTEKKCERHRNGDRRLFCYGSTQKMRQSLFRGAKCRLSCSWLQIHQIWKDLGGSCRCSPSVYIVWMESKWYRTWVRDLARAINIHCHGFMLSVSLRSLLPGGTSSASVDAISFVQIWLKYVW